MKYIGIVGSRSRDSLEDYNIVLQAYLNIIQDGDVIISGGCPKGADRFAEIIAKDYNVRIVLFQAEWHKYGKGAGFVRNTDIAKLSDVLMACVSNDRKGGTEDTVKKFRKFHPEGTLILC